jgi:hypothetical protein
VLPKSLLLYTTVQERKTCQMSCQLTCYVPTWSWLSETATCPLWRPSTTDLTACWAKAVTFSGSRWMPRLTPSPSAKSTLVAPVPRGPAMCKNIGPEIQMIQCCFNCLRVHLFSLRRTSTMYPFNVQYPTCFIYRNVQMTRVFLKFRHPTLHKIWYWCRIRIWIRGEIITDLHHWSSGHFLVQCQFLIWFSVKDISLLHRKKTGQVRAEIGVANTFSFLFQVQIEFQSVITGSRTPMLLYNQDKSFGGHIYPEKVEKWIFPNVFKHNQNSESFAISCLK